MLLLPVLVSGPANIRRSRIYAKSMLYRYSTLRMDLTTDSVTVNLMS